MCELQCSPKIKSYVGESVNPSRNTPSFGKFVVDFSERLQRVAETYLEKFDEHHAFDYLIAELFATTGNGSPYDKVRSVVDPLQILDFSCGEKLPNFLEASLALDCVLEMSLCGGVSSGYN